MATTIVKNWHAIYSRVRSALMRRGRTSHEAEDILQDAWVKMACYEREHPIEQPEAFLMRIALNLSIDAHRARVSHGEEVALEYVVLLDTAPGTEEIVLARERVVRLGQCLGRLNDKTREIFLAHRVDGMSYKAIAQRHGVSVSTVEKHVAKATLQLSIWMQGW